MAGQNLDSSSQSRRRLIFTTGETERLTIRPAGVTHEFDGKEHGATSVGSTLGVERARFRLDWLMCRRHDFCARERLRGFEWARGGWSLVAESIRADELLVEPPHGGRKNATEHHHPPSRRSDQPHAV